MTTPNDKIKTPESNAFDLEQFVADLKPIRDEFALHKDLAYIEGLDDADKARIASEKRAELMDMCGTALAEAGESREEVLAAIRKEIIEYNIRSKGFGGNTNTQNPLVKPHERIQFWNDLVLAVSAGKSVAEEGPVAPTDVDTVKDGIAQGIEGVAPIGRDYLKAIKAHREASGDEALSLNEFVQVDDYIIVPVSKANEFGFNLPFNPGQLTKVIVRDIFKEGEHKKITLGFLGHRVVVDGSVFHEFIEKELKR